MSGIVGRRRADIQGTVRWRPRGLALATPVCVVAVLVSGMTLLSGQAAGQSDADVLQELDLPWYDANNAEVKAMPLKDLKSSRAEHRETDWLYQPKSRNLSQNTATTGSGSPPAAPWLSTLVSWSIWILVGLVCIALFVWIAWLLLKQEWRTKKSESMADWEKDLQLDPARIEALPFNLATNHGDFLAQARQAQAEGRLKDAMVFLFSYMLLKLDKHQWIRLAKGKTNRNYLRELRQQQDLQSLLERTVVTFEDVFFGDLPIEPKEFQARWGDLDQFHRLVEARSA